MKKFLLLFIISALNLNLIAQFVYEKNDTIVIIKNGTKLKHPFLGGINAPQFSEIDLNQDGTMDLLITDRSGARVSPFINNGTPNQVDYSYAPEFIPLFPEIDNWLITRDYDCDGKMDLLIGSSSIKIYRNVSQQGTNLRFVYVDMVRSEYDKFEFDIDGTSPINPGSVDIPAIYDIDNDGDLDILFFGSNGSKLEYHKNLSIENTGNCGLDMQRRSKCWGDFTESNLTGKIFLDSCRFGDIMNAEFSRKGDINQTTKGLKHSGSTTTAYDFDNNGSTDVLIGDIDSRGLSALFNDDTSGGFSNSHFFKMDTLFPNYNTPIDMPIFPAAYFLDLNNDNLEDMIVSTNSNFFRSYTKTKDNILFYKNNGNQKNQFELQQSANLFFDESIDLGKGNNPSFFDYNKDGLIDLAIGNQGNLDSAANQLQATISLFENTGTITTPEFTLVDENYLNLPSYPLNLKDNTPTENVVLTFGDIDNDGDDDLIIGDGIGNLHLFIDTASGNNPASFKLEKAGYENIQVFENASPFLFDINKDSLLDLVIGNAQGFLEYYPNFGTKTEAVFTLKIESIIWQSGNTIRLKLDGTPNLSLLEIGQKLDINFATNQYNNVFQNISAINQNQNYIEVTNSIRNDNSFDEPTTSAIIDYSNKKWGGVDLSFLNYTRDTDPFIYEINGVQYLLVGNRGSERIRRTPVLFYDSINNPNNNGVFNLLDTNYLKLQEGEYIRIAGADLNNDGQVDLAVGNDAGGFSLYFAQYPVGINDISFKSKRDKKLFSLFPNPTKEYFEISIFSQSAHNSRMTLRDASGKIIIDKRITSISEKVNTEGLSAGVYFVTIISDSIFDTQKLIIRP